MSTKYQDLLFGVIKNRIENSSYDKEEMMENISILLADMRITAEQYNELKRLMGEV